MRYNDIEAAKGKLRQEADRVYCRYIDKVSSRECLGEDAKLWDGKFGIDELDAHRDARELLGVHRGIYKAIAALTEAQASEADTRAHHEAQIQRFNSTRGDELEDAITTLAFRNGLSWFSEDQIADIRDLMIQTAADKRRRAAESRAHYAAVQASKGAT